MSFHGLDGRWFGCPAPASRGQILDLPEKEGWPISVSLGAVTFFEVPTSLDDAIGQVDHLMYRVKAGGKNATLQEVVGADRSLES